MTWSIIVGNGFTIDAARHCDVCSPNYPWGWPIRNPENNSQPFLDVLPKLKVCVDRKRQNSGLEKLKLDILDDIVRKTEHRPPHSPNHEFDRDDLVHTEACHYLRMSYAWYSEQFSAEKLKKWSWCDWFFANGPDIATILSYNYDTILEATLRLASLGITYGDSRTNPLFDPGDPFMFEQPAKCYKNEQFGDRRTIYIAKPHGSCNFTSCGEWASSDGSPYYPITSFVVRDQNLRILEGAEVQRRTYTADIILPGEWSIWWNNTKDTRVRWASKQKQYFVEQSQDADKLLIIGFSCSDQDKKEFNDLLNKMSPFQEIHIVVGPDAEPSDNLKTALAEIAINKNFKIHHQYPPDHS